MNYLVYFTQQADADLDEILNFIALDSSQNALSFVDQLQHRINTTLNMAPYGGINYGESQCIWFKNYVVVYDIDDINKAVYVLFISEGSRQWQKVFSKRN